MWTCDSITSSNYMSKTGIVISIAKRESCSPTQVYRRLAEAAACRVTRLLGTRIVFAFDGLEIEDETLSIDLVLKRFRRALLDIAKAEIGIV